MLASLGESFGFRKFLPLGLRALDCVSSKLAARAALNVFFTPGHYPRPSEEQEFWESGEPIVFASGCCGRAYGTGQRTIWMVHGWESRGSRFKALAPACVAAGFRVVLWEGPAHGQSPGRRANIGQFTRTLMADIAARPESIDVLLGHSYGGGAAGYACALGVPVPKLVIIASPSHVLCVFEQFWNLVGLSALARKWFVKFAESAVGAKLDAVSSRHYIAKLPQQVLVIHDRNDKEISFSEVEYLPPLRADLKLLVTAGYGHRRILAAPEVINAVRDFIT